ncbi:malto-oligosyltrehalose trehalohydrolase [Rhizobium sp. R72]|uniref:malto-oligosyltrehalose trehalohydrolase n=1 Tax=unclassified Rhizobium TaxID=2613769 RepID=UPI000B535A60|nr:MULTISPECIES: malto-oligosyltrehalose trehalohydrolase [unclassified Rhizobium]OWW02402.1 malto-oligosyltrehalose trehalohydrolase [Rhizobium sp. R72]OWW02536.1 malto-oligosyltrehalose trehalohydrolase [Rhizobium sp. R711]
MNSQPSRSRTYSDKQTRSRRYPIGAELVDGGVSFRVWAPSRARVHVVIDGAEEHELQSEPKGYFSAFVPGVTAGARYWLRLDDQLARHADPASRFQSTGTTGPSIVIDPHLYAWSDKTWRGPSLKNLVLYELHVGTFTREGTLAAASRRLSSLKEIGISCVELMPLNEFEGEFGWGYDGTLLYAPTHLYGTPDDLRAFVDAAHQLNISVIVDVVYNHFGHGNRFADFTPDYFTDRYENEWGQSINFDGRNSHGVREYIAQNAAYWIDEYHLDGLRIDATQALFDQSPEHIISVIARTARGAAGNRRIILISENEPQEAGMVRHQQDGGYGLDALWNDDFHHSAMVAITGRREAYYHDHRGSAQEFVSAAKYGYLFQGQRYDWQDAGRGSPALDLTAQNFVHFLQNHDQIANSTSGARISEVAAPARLRAMTALLLLGPQIPMLFQGQEFAATAPFCYFADRVGELARNVRQGRVDFISQFPNLTDPALISVLADPCDRNTFEQAKLDWSERDAKPNVVALHRDLLALRQSHVAFRTQSHSSRHELDGSVISDSAFLLRYRAPAADDERLLIVNIGKNLAIDSLPDPLFAPPSQTEWQLIWSSEDPAYGGSGRRPYDFARRWVLNADCALMLAPVRRRFLKRPSAGELRDWQNQISRR